MAESLTIFQLNDTHAYLEPHPELFWNGRGADYRTAGGFARIATLLQEARRDQPGRVLALDGGDTLHGTYPAVQTKGHALIPILNALGLDAMSAHWEFAYGPDGFRQVAAQLNYPPLAINCYDSQTGRLVFQPYLVRELGRLRVGIIGIMATIVDKTMPAHFSQGIRFTLGNEELPGVINRLRQDEKVDVVIVLSHLGFPQDMKLAQEVSGMDVLLSAHTHNRLYQPAVVNSTIIIQSGCHGSFVGRLDVEVENRRVTGFRHQLITVSESLPPDPTVQGLVYQALAPYREELGRVVGRTATGLNRNTVLEATMDNLLLHSLLDITGCPVAFSNGWRYGAPIPPGLITMNDLYNIIPVNPPLSTVQMTGDEIRALLEENLEHTFARDPYHQMGGYLKRALGLRLYFKLENPHGQRVQELFIQDEPVRGDKLYDVVFVTEQGVPARYGTNRQQTTIKAVQALRRYVQKHRTVEAELQGTMVAV
ncbi:MAG: 5'-nucleotidase C-terminal domain-containing protein [Chloroflexi bacterium]|nr:5'-nucleotidase C-terminal domain-containing protein [Chloroflexota bacterium]